MITQSADTFYKALLSEILGDRWRCQFDFDRHRKVQMGPICADLDGVIVNGSGTVVCAVEIESRTAKQIRGSILDLALHPARKKLLLVDPVNIKLGKTLEERDEKCRRHFENVWERLAAIGPGELEIVVLDRTGRASILAALRKLGIIEG